MSSDASGGDTPSDGEAAPPGSNLGSDAGGTIGGNAGTYSLQESVEHPPRSPMSAIPPRSTAPRVAKRSRNAGSGFWLLVGCNAIVFVTSVCIMVLELTATRLVAKHIGASLYTWTSVIGVVLAGITVGNFLGGWLADRCEHSGALSWMFLTSSILSAGVLWLDTLAARLPRPEAIDWPVWVVIVVAGIFLLPAIAMGTISPVVASWALSQRRQVGITVGNVYAWGALGSIVGTFLAGFYLIDTFGTKSIVGMVAMTLGVMGAVVAVGRQVFRAAVVAGWLQFLFVLSLVATTTAPSASQFAGAISGIVTWTSAADARDARAAEIESLGMNVGRKLHELGLLLGLRRDDPHEYHDESSYSYINVSDDVVAGQAVKTLRLDKLIHSYYNPADPTALYYDYERIYAAVTELAAAKWDRTTSVALDGAALGGDSEWAWPEWVLYDAAAGRLEILGALSAGRREELLSLSTAASFWNAVEQLTRSTQSPEWAGFESLTVGKFPEGLSIPASLAGKVRYDDLLGMLVCTAPLDEDDAAALIEAGPDAAFYRAVQQLSAQSREVATFFIGGGGFVFPRWIEEHFPRAPRIDVAEIDPAVHLAVQRELGLPVENHTAVRTLIGDARNIVDDRLRDNERLMRAGEEPVRYDFIYGDAFNDFSVPWHLTTHEFTEKIRELLRPDGVYLVNIIDIYPRTEFPQEYVAMGEVEFSGALPPLANEPLRSGAWIAAEPRFGQLQMRREPNSPTVRLRFEGTMSDEVHSELYDLAPENTAFQDAVQLLSDRTWTRRTLSGEPPVILIPTDFGTETWQRCPPPFTGLEIMRSGNGGYLLGVRGAMSADVRTALMKVAASDQELQFAVEFLFERSRERREGQFLGRFVLTAATVFPNVYVFSSELEEPHDDRDTFVVVASQRPLDFADLSAESDYWPGRPFAARETEPESQQQIHRGQMSAVIALSRGIPLTDDFAPVDNLLAPVVSRQK